MTIQIRTSQITLLFLPIVTFVIVYLFTGSTNEPAVKKSYQEQFNDDYKVYALNLPESTSFAGENIPIKIPMVAEKLDRELLVNTYWQSNTLLLLKRSNKYFPIIVPILKKNGIPEDFKYLAVIESGLTQITSPAGAKGFWQIMKSTGKEYGLEIYSEVDERYHIEKSTQAACDYLNMAHNKFGNWTLAAASYNMGMGGLNNQLKKQQVNSYYDLLLNSETGRYVYRIIAAKEILSHPENFGFQYREDQLWHYPQTNKVEIDTSISNLAEFAKAQGINYNILKEFNPWLRSNTLKVSEGNSYEIEIPIEELKPKYQTE